MELEIVLQNWQNFSGLSKTEITQRARMLAKDWVTKSIVYENYNVLLLRRLYEKYKDQKGTLTQKSFYNVVRYLVNEGFPGIQDNLPAVKKTLEGISLINISSNIKYNVLYTDKFLNEIEGRVGQ